uniref:Putative Glycosyl transferase n=1 Tax=Streptomyces versipellis TaxID=67375 RepID=A0A0B6VSP3_9ACTN|nr:putative Glycosyl transferase [Streptomyces versipellis]
MRVLFMPLPMPTHYFPVVPLAFAFRAAGHEVRIVSQPPLVDTVIQSGMISVPLGAGYDYQEGMRELAKRDLEVYGRPLTADMLQQLPPEEGLAIRNRMRDGQIKVAEAMADELVAYMRHWQPDLVVADPLVLAAPLAGAAVGVPLVHYMWAPDILRQQLNFPGLGTPVTEWPEELLQLFARHGADPCAEPAIATVDPCPPSLQVDGVPNRIPFRCVPYNASGVEPDWVSGGSADRARRICVTWGTTASLRGGVEGSVIPKIVESVAGPDREVVLALAESEWARLGDLPDGVRLVAGLPLHVLLPSCDAIVHQGGGGALLAAAYSGVPQVTLPATPDARLNVSLLAATGAGTTLAVEADTVDIREAVSSVLTGSGPREAADRLREEILTLPSPAELVPVLEKLI